MTTKLFVAFLIVSALAISVNSQTSTESTAECVAAGNVTKCGVCTKYKVRLVTTTTNGTTTVVTYLSCVTCTSGNPKAEQVYTAGTVIADLGAWACSSVMFKAIGLAFASFLTILA